MAMKIKCSNCGETTWCQSIKEWKCKKCGRTNWSVGI